jgi:hypothetical protein
MIDRRIAQIGCAGVALISLASVPVDGFARSRSSVVEEREIARCIRLAAGGKPWLERTLWALRDQEGGWLGASVLNTNGSRDLGPLQINSWWVPRIASLVGRPVDQVHSWLRTDACFNAEVARWIFLTALGQSRDYWRAIGVYHSPTGWRQQRYALSVAGKMHARFGPLVFSRKETPTQPAPQDSATSQGQGSQRTKILPAASYFSGADR